MYKILQIELRSLWGFYHTQLFEWLNNCCDVKEIVCITRDEFLPPSQAWRGKLVHKKAKHIHNLQKEATSDG